MSESASEQNLSNLVSLSAGVEKIRELPNNLQAEQNFLGALLLDNDILDRLNVQLRPEHFYDLLHVQIFEAATRLISRAQLASPVTLKTFFHDHADFGDGRATSYLGDLVDGVISISEAKDYADVIHQTYLRRELVRISDNVIHDAQNPDIEIPAQTQIEAAEQHLFTLAEDDTAEGGLKSLVYFAAPL